MVLALNISCLGYAYVGARWGGAQRVNASVDAGIALPDDAVVTVPMRSH